MAVKIEDVMRLLARLRGTVTLSYSCRELISDREQFPSSVLGRAGVLSSKLTAFAPASFAPLAPDHGLTTTEWWLGKLCAEPGVYNQCELTAACFSHLGRGQTARAARESDRFTEYDGYVPEAGQDFITAQPNWGVLSASGLETFGRCPLDFFFQYVLELKPPEEYEADLKVWLDPLKKGGLLHEVFKSFIQAQQHQQPMVQFDRDAALLDELFTNICARYRAKFPPPREDVFQQECAQLRQITRVFLCEQEELCETYTPAWCEAAIGMVAPAAHTPLDWPDPLPLALPGGLTVRARGRIDRVDIIGDPTDKTYALWDYKTGLSGRYDEADPFQRGRVLQNALYQRLVETRLRDACAAEVQVVQFGYFFTNLADHGSRMVWPAPALKPGLEIISQLCRMMAQGCFPVSNEEKDLSYSDYRVIYGDAAAASRQLQQKLENAGEPVLEIFRRLRGDE